MYSPRWLGVVGAVVFLVPLAPGFARAQEPAPASTPPPPAAQPQAPATNPAPPAAVSSSRKKSSHASDFLIIGTVFTDKAFAFPGVQLRVRRATEKKFRWETYTNSRGEFAVRVPQGLQYEMVIAAKGFAVQTRMIDARSGISEDDVVFRMEPVAGGKK
jgi:hypothetical protein